MLLFTTAPAAAQFHILKSEQDGQVRPRYNRSISPTRISVVVSESDKNISTAESAHSPVKEIGQPMMIHGVVLRESAQLLDVDVTYRSMEVAVADASEEVQ